MDNPGLFLNIFVLFTLRFELNKAKRICCDWDSNSGSQEMNWTFYKLMFLHELDIFFVQKTPIYLGRNYVPITQCDQKKIAKCL